MTTVLQIKEILYCNRTHQVFCITYHGVNIVTGDAYNAKSKEPNHFKIGYRQYLLMKMSNEKNDFSRSIEEINKVARFTDRPVITT